MMFSRCYILIFLILITSNAIGQGLVPEDSFGNKMLSDTEFASIRCQPHGQTTYFSALGEMYSQVEGKRGVPLFKFLGIDVSRCVVDPADGRLWLLSRKISLYLDPKTGEILKSWKNPWTSENLNVMHRTYDYQEFLVPKSMASVESEQSGAVSLDFNVLMPNPLAEIARFAEYSPEKQIQSYDSYKFVYSKTDPNAVTLSYFRSGTWEPWMKQKGLPGKLILNYSGHRIQDFQAIPKPLQNLLNDKMPLFKEAPQCRLERSIAVSWSRFNESFDAYRRGVEFPLPEPMRDEPCINPSQKK